MSNPIVIEKHIPVPSRSKIPPLPLDRMEVNESFLLDLSELCENPERAKAAVRQRVQRFQRANFPKRFSMRKIDDTHVRIFRFPDREPDTDTGEF